MLDHLPADTSLDRALRASWGADTCDPADSDRWHPGNPSRGQRGVTALVVHDHLGGRLVTAAVHRGTEQVGWHHWNELPDGHQVDLTRVQFDPDEVVGPGRLVVRPDGPQRRCREQYELLAGRVSARLGGPPGAPGAGAEP